MKNLETMLHTLESETATMASRYDAIIERLSTEECQQLLNEFNGISAFHNSSILFAYHKRMVALRVMFLRVAGRAA